MSKQLHVSSAIQAALMNELILAEIRDGFWKDQRPATHGAAWDGVEVIVAPTNTVGPVGDWKPLRNYDFMAPKFTELHEAELVRIAQTVKPNMTFKALKKELIELSRIVGGRMTDKTQEPARAYRGNNRSDYDVIRSVDRKKVMTPAGAKAAVDAALKDVKKTAVKKVTAVKTAAKKPAPTEAGVTVTKTSSGATVRRVAVSAFPTAQD